MLQNESILSVADNSGAKKLLVIRCLGGSNRRYSRIGDLVKASVKEASPDSPYSKSRGKERIKIVDALIVTTRRYFRRQNNTWIRFSKNYAVLVKRESKEIKPVGSQIFVPLLAEFAQWGYKEVFSLAREVL
jgi:large subunit ribosomal protein L14